MTSYLPLILPPIAIRFGYFKRPLSYGLELFVSMWVSTFVHFILVFILTGVSVETQGLLGIVVPYVLPYRVWTGLYLFYEAPFIALMVNCHLPKAPKESSFSQSSYTPPPPPPHEEAPRSRQDEAVKLVNLGLACIGRKTKRTNLYFTPEREAERHRAEYTFLRQLAEKYRDAATRKVLAQHFMLFKEFCLFIIFSVVLKGDTELHTLVRTELTERLTEDLDIMTKTRRKQYMFAFSKAFYDAYQRTHSMERTLSYSFWNVLAEKHPELLILQDISGIGAAYRYTYDVLKKQLQIEREYLCLTRKKNSVIALNLLEKYCRCFKTSQSGKCSAQSP